jgi:hypothetical protein
MRLGCAHADQKRTQHQHGKLREETVAHRVILDPTASKSIVHTGDGVNVKESAYRFGG